MDVEVCGEGGYNVGWIAADEWLEYTIDAAFGGSYEITLRTASIFGTGEVHVEIDGVDVTGPVSVPNTGGWQTYTDVSAGYATLTAGPHILRVYADGPDFNINHITLTALPPDTPSGLVAVPVSAGQLDLTWSVATGAQYYTVKRSVSSGGPYGVVASNMVANSFSDTLGLTAGTRYYYVVSAVNAGGQSGNSNETNAVPSVVIVQGEYFIANHEIVNGTSMSLTVSNSILGHDYWILATDSLLAPDWQLVGVGQAGTGSNLAFNVPVDGVESNQFFKLDVQRQ